MRVHKKGESGHWHTINPGNNIFSGTSFFMDEKEVYAVSHANKWRRMGQ